MAPGVVLLQSSGLEAGNRHAGDAEVVYLALRKWLDRAAKVAVMAAAARIPVMMNFFFMIMKFDLLSAPFIQVNERSCYKQPFRAMDQ